jgi:protein-S-isoprenylcysteine O-methyltransferase Ste14
MTTGQFFFKYRSYTPLVFVIPLLLYARPSLLTMLIGLLIAAIGEYLRFWGVSYAGSETRTTKVGAGNLATQGPFAYLRNPLYAGNILIYFGISIMANSLFPYLQIIALLFFYIQYHFIIEEEEDFLRSKYKEKYDDYFKSVNKFLPKTSPYDPLKQSKIKQNLKEAYKSEKRTFQSFSFIIFLIVLIYILIHS